MPKPPSQCGHSGVLPHSRHMRQKLLDAICLDVAGGEHFHHYQKTRLCGWILEDTRLLDKYHWKLVHPDQILLKHHLKSSNGIEYTYVRIWNNQEPKREIMDIPTTTGQSFINHSRPVTHSQTGTTVYPPDHYYMNQGLRRGDVTCRYI